MAVTASPTKTRSNGNGRAAAEIRSEFIHRESEARILGAIILDPDFLMHAQDAGLEPRHFAMPDNGALFAVLRELVLSGEPITPPTVADWLAANRPDLAAAFPVSRLFELADGVVSVMGALADVDHVIQAWRLRRVIDSAVDIVNAARQRDLEAVQRGALELVSIQGEARGQRPVSGVEAMEAALRERERAASGDLSSWLTWPEPWASWHEVVQPLPPGMLMNIAASGGVGKSTYLDMIAEHNAARGLHVLIVSLEDSPAYRAARQLARWSGIPLHRIERAPLSVDEERALEWARQQIRGFGERIHFLHAPGANMAYIEAAATRMRILGQCDALMIDYIDLVTASPDQRAGRIFGYEREEDDMRRLKALAERLGIPIVFANQGRKGSENDMSEADIKGSGARYYMAQLVMILQRPRLQDDFFYNGREYPAGARSPIVTVSVPKQNRGGTRRFTQFFDGPVYTVSDVRRQPLE